MFKPVAVEPRPDYRLWIRYADGVEGEVDVSHLAGRGVFEIWNDYAIFEQVAIGEHGQIAWGENVDICPDAAYLEITGMTLEEARARAEGVDA